MQKAKYQDKCRPKSSSSIASSVPSSSSLAVAASAIPPLGAAPHPGVLAMRPGGLPLRPGIGLPLPPNRKSFFGRFIYLADYQVWLIKIIGYNRITINLLETILIMID